MGQRTLVGISADRVVALIADLLLIQACIALLFTQDVLQIVFAIVGLIISVILLVAMNIFDMKMRKNIPYDWWMPLAVGGLLLLFMLLGWVTFLLPMILMILAGIIGLLEDRKSYIASKLVVIVGAGWAIYQSILSLMSGDVGVIILGILGLICGVLLILSLPKNTKFPYSWWYILIIGWFLFAFLLPEIGIVVLVGFVLILMAY